jgi:hypothetical protein
MTVLSRILTCSRLEYRLLLQAAPVVVGVRVALWVLPSRFILRVVRRLAVQASNSAAPPSVAIGMVIWAVEAVSRRVPRATCLTQALAAQLLLRAHGYDSTLCLGVAGGGSDDFMAHAWVERQGRVLIGGSKSRLLTRLPDLAHGRDGGSRTPGR